MSDGEQLEYEEESGRQQQVPQSSGSDLPVKEGAVFGAIAVVATYLTHLLVTAVVAGRTSPETYIDESGDSPALVVTDLVPSWIAAGWSYLSTFGVGFEASGEAATLGDAPNNVAAMANSPFMLSDTLLFVATIGSVVAAGYAVASYTDADDPVEAVKAAVTVVPPYLVFGAIAAFLMTHTFSDQHLVRTIVGQPLEVAMERPNPSPLNELGTVRALDAEQFVNDDGEITGSIDFGPSTTDAILFAGIVIPAVLAAAGGLVTQWRDAVNTAVAKVSER